MRQCLVIEILACVLLTAQQNPTSPSFEVASVKISNDDLVLPPFITGQAEMRMRFQGGPGTKSPERINYIGATLKMLIQRAYDVRPEQVIGPAWLATQRYTISAKVPPGTTPQQFSLMLQDLLNERFKIRLHRETKPIHVYQLVVSKQGPKLKPEETVTPFRDEEERKLAALKGMTRAKAMRDSLGFRPTNTIGLGGGGTMGDFIDRLAAYLDRPVIDRTQLDGFYVFWLSWVADDVKQKENALQGPSIFAALREQLGLELKPVTDEVLMLVIDAVERTPAEN